MPLRIMETDLALLLACMPTAEQCGSEVVVVGRVGQRRHEHLRREHSAPRRSDTPEPPLPTPHHHHHHPGPPSVYSRGLGFAASARKSRSVKVPFNGFERGVLGNKKKKVVSPQVQHNPRDPYLTPHHQGGGVDIFIYLFIYFERAPHSRLHASRGQRCPSRSHADFMLKAEVPQSREWARERVHAGKKKKKKLLVIS